MAIWLKTAPGGRVIVGMATCGCAALPGGAAAMASGVSEEELTGVSAIDDRVTDFIDVRATAPGRWYSAPRFKATEDDDDDEEEDEGQGRAGCGPVQRPLAPDGSRAAVRANVLCISRLLNRNRKTEPSVSHESISRQTVNNHLQNAAYRPFQKKTSLHSNSTNSISKYLFRTKGLKSIKNS